MGGRPDAFVGEEDADAAVDVDVREQGLVSVVAVLAEKVGQQLLRTHGPMMAWTWHG